MTAPNWIEAVVRDFGQGAGITNFALNDRGVAACRFETGVSLRFEYVGEEFIVAVTVPSVNSAAVARRILAVAHPEARYGAAIRAGYLTKSGCAVFAVRITAQEVTLPILNTVFSALWRIATEIGGAA